MVSGIKSRPSAQVSQLTDTGEFGGSMKKRDGKAEDAIYLRQVMVWVCDYSVTHP